MVMKMLKAQIEFFAKFAQMLTSGIPTVPVLEILHDECSCHPLKKELVKMRKAVSGGGCLKDATVF